MPRLVSSSGETVPTGRRARGILCYLALARDRRAPRERLCSLFWWDRPPAQARASLRQTLLELRHALPPGAVDPLHSDREFVALAPCVLTDLEVAETAQAPRALLAELAAIGAEPPLDGLEFGEAFDDWEASTAPVLERRLRAATLAGLDEAVTAGDHMAARSLADAWALRDPLDEAVAARAISAELAIGDRSAAERRYRALAQLLKSELGTTPGPAVAAALATPAAAQAASPTRTAAEPPAAAEAIAPAGSRRWSPIRIGAIALAAIGVVAATALLLRPTAPPTDPVIAVLPFQAPESSADDGLLAQGIAEEVMAGLAADPRIKVMGRATSAALAVDGQPAPGRLTALGVTHLLSGTFRPRADGPGVALEARLVDSRSGALLWRATLDIDETGIASAGDDLARRVAAELVDAPASAVPPVGAGTSPPPDAHRRILLARQHIHSREAKQLVEAWELAGQALAIAPDWAEAHATRSIAASLMQNYTDMPLQPLVAEATSAAARAIALDPELPAAQEALSFALEGVEPDKALAAASRAVLLQPGNAAYRRRLAWLLRRDGQYRQAIAELEAAIAIDPLWLIPYIDLGMALGQTNQPSRLVELQQRFAALQPPKGEAELVRANMLLDTGRAGEAVPIASALMRTDPELTYAALTWIDALTALFGAREVPADVEALNTLPALAALARGDTEAAGRLALADGPSAWDDAESAVVLSHALLSTGNPSRLLQAHGARFPKLESYLGSRPSPLALNRHPGLHIARALSASGNAAAAEQVRRKVAADVRRLEQGGLAISQSSITVAALDLMEGRPGPALDRLEAGMAAQWTAICHGPIWIGTDPLFDGLATEPRFNALQARCRDRLNGQRKAAGLAPLPRS